MFRLESTILKNLIYNAAYMGKVIPYLKHEYFKEPTERLVFTEIASFIEKYKNSPTHEALVITLTETNNLKEEQVRDGVELLKQLHLDRNEATDLPWLTDQTEKFVKDAALYNAVLEAVQILDEKGKEHKKPKESIPGILTDALAISFDPHVGHDYLLQAESRHDYYQIAEKKIPFDLEFFNKVTGGGFSRKSLNILLAGPNVGKSLVMCHFAAAAMARGFNVLYITLEMSEEEIGRRIDANLLNVDINTLESLPRIDYQKKFVSLMSKTTGKLIIKEYPTAAASTLHFRALLNELVLKKSFRPDIIFVDYLNICTSSRIREGGNVNSYTYVKAIGQELRGLAVEFDVPVVSATQTTRGGFNDSDLEMTDTSESFGLPAIADFMAAIISNEDLEALGQFMIKILKNRTRGKKTNKRFVVGVDYPYMRLYDVAPSAQINIQNPGQVPVSPAKPFDRPKQPRGRDFSKFKI